MIWEALAIRHTSFLANGTVPMQNSGELGRMPARIGVEMMLRL